jgi:hypothetical protein
MGAFELLDFTISTARSDLVGILKLMNRLII